MTLADSAPADAPVYWWFYAYAAVSAVAAVVYGFRIGWTVAAGLEAIVVLAIAVGSPA